MLNIFINDIEYISFQHMHNIHGIRVANFPEI